MMTCKILLLTCLVGPACGAEYCAFHVVVEDPAGRSSGVSVPVVVRDSAGRVVASSKTRDGKADLCDVGFGSFDIEIGSDELCGQIFIRHVPTRLGVDVTLKAVLNDCLDPSWIADGCMVLLRARDGNGDPVPRARLETDGRSTESQTDSYGRLLFGIGFGETSTLKLVSEASASASVTLSCSKKEPKLQRTLILR